MPYPNEHAARIKDPSAYSEIKRQNNEFGQGIDVLYGVLANGKSEVQSIRFKSSDFTVAEAEAWLKEHDYTPIEFEPAASADRSDVTTVTRYDRALVRAKPVRTSEGYLKAEASATRVGVFDYVLPDGSIMHELRHPDEVWSSDSIETLKMIPVTLDHPATVRVTAETAKRYQVGATGENIRPDGQWVVVPIVITDQKAIDSVEAGKTSQVSLGYQTELVPENGVYDGVPYTHRQTNIRYNHLALVDRARAGSGAVVHLDSFGGVQKECITHNDKGKKMAQYRIDGIDYEAAPEVINFITRATERADAAETKNADLQSKIDSVTAERDTAKAELEKMQKIDHAQAIADGVKARSELVSKAGKVLDAETKVDSMSDKDIKVAVIKKVHADADLEGKSDDYINARFDAAIEVSKVSAESMIDSREKLKQEEGNVVDASKARQNMIDRLQNAWKGEDK